MTPTFPNQTALTLVELCRQYLRAPSTFATDADTGNPVLVFVPPLTTAEQAALADLTGLARQQGALTLADWQATSPFVATMRALLALSQSEFMALTQAQRDRMIFDNLSAIERTLFRLLRQS